MPKKTINMLEKIQIEREYLDKGYRVIAGVDEVGRGPLAGPVVTCAVVMPLGEEDLIQGVDDSKKLSKKKREELAEEIQKRAVSCVISEEPAEVIDEINILQATRRAMKRSVEGLSVTPDMVLTDGNMTLDISYPQRSVVHGDALSYSIGAASIVAKVYRDKLMEKYAEEYPYYAFEKNAGYGTAAHIEGIKEHGVCKIHRLTFTKNF